MTKRANRAEDRKVVRGCLAHDSAAWRRLVAEYGPGIEATIIQALGKQYKGRRTVDEIAANVQNGLCERDFEALRKYDPTRGGLGTFLAAITKKQIAVYWRERKRRARELILSETKINEPVNELEETCVMVEALKLKLTPRLLEFFETHVLRQPTDSEAARFSAASRRKNLQRILKAWNDLQDG